MKRMIGIVLAVSLLAAACSSGGDVEVADVWARTSASMQDAGAVYMTITGGEEDDSLVGVSVDSSVAAMAELHQSMMDEEGMMMMQQVESIAVPADDEVKLEPGGYHVMLMQLAEPLTAGSEFTITVTFETAGDMDLTAEVRDN